VRGPLEDELTILLSEATPNGDLQAWVLGLQGLQVTEIAVELVVGVLPDAAGVEDDHVGRGDVVDALHALGCEERGDPLGVVLVHLTPEGADDEPPASGTNGEYAIAPGHPPRATARPEDRGLLQPFEQSPLLSSSIHGDAPHQAAPRQLLLGEDPCSDGARSNENIADAVCLRRSGLWTRTQLPASLDGESPPLNIRSARSRV